MSATKTTLRDGDPVDKLSLDDALALAGEDGVAELKDKATARLADLSSLSLATLQRALRRGHAGAAMFVTKALTVRPAHHTVSLPAKWTKAKTVAERAQILDQMLQRGQISPAQAKTLLEVSSFSSLQRELDVLKKKLDELESGGQPSEPARSSRVKREERAPCVDDLL